MEREVNFKLVISKNRARILEENQPTSISFVAPDLLSSEYLPDILAASLVRRIQEIIQEGVPFRPPGDR